MRSPSHSDNGCGRGILLAALALTFVLGSSIAARAQAEDPAITDLRAACAQSAAPKEQIANCTKLIETRRLQGRDLAQALYQRGLGHVALGQYTKAVGDFSQALKFAPDSTDALYNRGGAYSKLGRWADALADFDALLAIVPKDPNTLYARAWVRAQKGDDAAAIADLDQVLAIVPDDQESLLDRGGLNIRAGRFDAAIADFGRLLTLEPKAAAAAFNRGRAHYAKGDFKNAAEDFALASKLRPKNPYAVLRLHLAEAHLGSADQGKLAKSIEALGPTIWPRPLLELFAGTGDDEGLIAGINQLPEKQRTDVLCEAQYYLGERALLKGDAAAAKKYFTAAANSKATATTERIDAKLALAGLK